MARRTKVVVETELKANDKTSRHLINVARSARLAQNSVRGLVRGIGTITAAAGLAALAAGGIGIALKRSADAVADRGDEFAKLGRQVGVSAQMLQHLEFVAGRQGATFEGVTTGIETFTKRLGEAERGTGSLYSAFGKDNPGFLHQMANTNPEESLGLALEYLSQIENVATRTDIADKMFGRTGGNEMLRMLDGGSEAFRALMIESQKFRPPLGEEALTSAEEYKDAMWDARTVILSVRDALGVELMPVLTQAAKTFANWVASNRDFIKQGIDTIVASVSKFLNKTDWAAVAVNVGKFADAIASIPWSGIVTATASLAGNIEKIATASAVLVGLYTGSKITKAMANMRAMTGASVPRAGLAGLLSRINPYVAAVATGAFLGKKASEMTAGTPEQIQTSVNTFNAERTAPQNMQAMQSMMPWMATSPNQAMVANQLATAIPSPVEFGRAVANEITGALAISLSVDAPVRSVGVSNSSGLVGNVGTNLPRSGPR